MVSFREMYKMLENKGPGRATSSKGTIYKIEARNNSIIAFLESGKVGITIHDDCWGKPYTCQGTRAGGIYNGRDSIFEWYKENERQKLRPKFLICLNESFKKAEEERQKAIKDKKDHKDYKKISAKYLCQIAKDTFDDGIYDNRIPAACGAMRSIIEKGRDEVTNGNADGTYFTIRYKLPRKNPIEIEPITDINKAKNIVNHKSANNDLVKDENIDQDDIQEIVMNYYNQRDTKHRFSSFDYCYNYFYTTSDLTKDMEKSCLQIGFYLASWGMLRNSNLLQKSSKHYQKLIEYISTLNKDDWKIDVDKYNDASIKRLLDIYSNIKTILNGTDTLTTKIMLGVFGSIPAFDRYFKKTFHISSFNENAFANIKDFYSKNSKIIDELAKKMIVLNFNKENKTSINYPKAKIIDMYGFNKGLIIGKNKNG